MVEEKHQGTGQYSEAVTMPEAQRGKGTRERAMKHGPPGRSCGLPESKAASSL